MNIIEAGVSRIGLSRAIEVPKFAVNGARQFFSEAFSGTVELVLPKDAPTIQVRKMKMLEPLHDAKLGESTLVRGNKIEQDELVIWGGLMIVRAALKAENAQAVPDKITRQVCEIANNNDVLQIAELHMPEDLLNPATEVIEKYMRQQNNVVAFQARQR